jgi:amino acid adenylation domain-containing protein
VIYTSGSLGQPKGVAVVQRALLHLIAWHQQAFAVSSDDRATQLASPAFDAAVWEIWPYLTAGASLHIPDELTRSVPERLRDWLLGQTITISFAPTPLAEQLLTLDWPATSALRTLLTGGDTLHLAPPPGCPFALINNYGPTEYTVVTTSGGVAPAVPPYPAPPIGEPIANTEAYVLDEQMEPVPRGVAGELYIGGAGLARGYLGRPDMTAAAFLPHPFAGYGDKETRRQGDKETPLSAIDYRLSAIGYRLYRTGDLVRARADGQLVFLGRRDQQVKLRGFRIELGEIESALASHPAVQEAVVVRREDVPGEPRLVAYVVEGSGVRGQGSGSEDTERSRQADKTDPTVTLSPGHLVTLSASRPPTPDLRSLIPELRAFLQPKLPAYMLPSAIVVLAQLPLTTNGKLDRRALPAPSHEHDEAGGAGGEPRDSVELRLVQLWEELLNIGPISITDDFFALGGHSLLAVQLMARIKQVFGSELPIAILFQGATVEQLARAIRERSGDPSSSPLVDIQPRGAMRPFFCVHPIGGHVLCYTRLARHLGPQQPFYGLQAAGLLGQQMPHTRIEDMATAYIDALRAVQAEGPYLLGGWSMGGVVAFEMAQQLHQQGHAVALLALLDSHAPDPAAPIPADDEADLAISFVRDLVGLSMEELPIAYDDFRQLDPDKRLRYLLELAKTANIVPADTEPHWIERLFEIFKANMQALRSYKPGVYPNQITLFHTAADTSEPTLGWSAFTSEPVAAQAILGDHYTMLAEPNVRVLASTLTHSFESLIAV